MLTINGRKYARNAGELVESLFHAPPTAHGLYRVRRGAGRVAIELQTAKGEPVALISPDAVFVTAFRFEKTTRYMFALTDDSTRFLGFEATSISDQRRIAAQALTEATA